MFGAAGLNPFKRFMNYNVSKAALDMVKKTVRLRVRASSDSSKLNQFNMGPN